MTRFFLTAFALLAILQTPLVAQDAAKPAKPAMKPVPKVAAAPGAFQIGPDVRTTTDTAAARVATPASGVVGPQQSRRAPTVTYQNYEMDPRAMDSTSKRAAPAAKRPPPLDR